MNLRRCSSLWKPKHNPWGETGHAISKFCTSQATKNELVGHSGWTSVSTLGWKDSKWMEHWEWNMSRHKKTQTCAKWQKRGSLQEPKQNSLCFEVCDAIRKLCAGQVTKNCVGRSTWHAVAHQVKPATNKKWTVTLCWAPFMLLSCQWICILRQAEFVFWDRSCNEHIVRRPGSWK